MMEIGINEWSRYLCYSKVRCYCTHIGISLKPRIFYKTIMITNLDSRDPTERSRCFATNPWRRVHYSSAVQMDIEK